MNVNGNDEALNETEMFCVLRTLAIKYQLCENTHSRFRIDYMRTISQGHKLTKQQMEREVRAARRIREDVPRLFS